MKKIPSLIVLSFSTVLLFVGGFSVTHAQGVPIYGTIGQSCNNSSALCVGGLDCDNGTCKKTNVAEGGSCGSTQLCAGGLSCSTSGRCVTPVVAKPGAGESCRGAGDCADGLVCNTSNRCQVFGPQQQSDAGGGGSSNPVSPGGGSSFGGSSQSSSFPPSGDTLFGVKDTIMNLINNVFIPVLFGIAFLVFLWGVYKSFIYEGADPNSHTEGRSLIMYGLIGFAVMVSVWGLVNVLTGTFGLDSGEHPEYPAL